MYLIQLLLPLYNELSEPIRDELFTIIRKELTDKFGGITAFMQSPAVGFWKEDKDNVNRDEIVVFEVMADFLDRSWWESYRNSLEDRLVQQEIVIRASLIERL